MTNPSILEHNEMIFKKDGGFDFPIFFDYYERAVASVWRHQEVAMEADLRDWQGATNLEREIISGILKGFVTSELGIGSYWSNVVANLFPKPEIVSMARAFAFFEVIHSSAYSYLNDLLGLDEYEAFINDPIALQKVESFFQKVDPKVSLALYSGGGEGVSLFCSFAVLLAFNLKGRFKGLAQIISWSARDEQCVDAQTEILTPQGWKSIADYQEGDKIAQFDPSTGTIEFVKPNKFIQKKSSEMYLLNKNQRFNQCVTPDHTLIEYTGPDDKSFKETLAKNWSHRQSYIPVAGHTINDRDITPLERFIIALQADGHIRKAPSKREVIFSFKRERKIARFKQLIEDLKPYGFEFKEYYDSKRRQTTFTSLVPDQYLNYRTKNFSDVFSFDDLPKQFLDEIMEWDGHRRKNYNTLYYSSKDENNVKFVQTVGSLFGYYGCIRIQDDFRHKKSCRQYRLNLKINDRINARYSGKTYIQLDEPIDVYCFKVDTGAFLIRREGLISITGNCHSDGGCYLFRKLVEEVGITSEEEQQIYEGMDLILQNELAFIDSIFQGRDILELDPNDLKSYIKVRTNMKLVELGLRPRKLSSEDIMRANKISSWFDPMIEGASSNDFFAQSKDGNNYMSKISQKFTEVDLTTIRNELDCLIAA